MELDERGDGFPLAVQVRFWLARVLLLTANRLIAWSRVLIPNEWGE